MARAQGLTSAGKKKNRVELLTYMIILLSFVAIQDTHKFNHLRILFFHSVYQFWVINPCSYEPSCALQANACDGIKIPKIKTCIF